VGRGLDWPNVLSLNVIAAWVYILTNKTRSTLYVGVTTAFSSRLWEHRTRQSPDSFTARYNVDILVYYEEFELLTDAIEREKLIKGKTRKWKEDLIRDFNPGWCSLNNRFEDQHWIAAILLRPSPWAQRRVPGFKPCITRTCSRDSVCVVHAEGLAGAN